MIEEAIAPTTLPYVLAALITEPCCDRLQRRGEGHELEDVVLGLHVEGISSVLLNVVTHIINSQGGRL